MNSDTKADLDINSKIDSETDSEKQEKRDFLQKNREEKRSKDRRQTVQMLTLISQFGINMLVPIFLCFFVGMFIDKKLGTNYWAIISFFFGAIVGFRNVYVFARKNTKNNNASQSYEQLRQEIRDNNLKDDNHE